MPIKVQCDCGKAFAAKDELAGKTVKCPGCQKPLRIPTNSGNSAPAKSPAKPDATKAATAKPAAARSAVAAAPAPANDDLFDELGLAPPTEGMRPCPGCTEPMPLQAIICVKCGYNTRIGRRMTTERDASSDSVGHGAVAHDLLEKAASVIDGDEDEEKKKTNEGMPWWVYLLVLIVLISLGAFMLLRSGGEEKPEEGKTGLFARPSAISA